MIARFWRGQATGRNAASYEKHIRETVFPSMLTMRGHLGAHLLRRAVDDQVEFVAVTLWSSLDDIRQFAGANIDLAHIEPEARRVLSGYDDFARHFELVHSSGSSCGAGAQKTA